MIGRIASMAPLAVGLALLVQPALHAAAQSELKNESDRVLDVELAGATVLEPGAPRTFAIKVTNRTDKLVSAAAEFSIQCDAALFSRRPPDAVYGSDHAQGAKSWTEADGKILEEGSLTDGKDWTSAGTEWNRDHFLEAFQTIDLGRVRRVTHMTWLSGDANWVSKVDVAASLDGTSYTAVLTLQNVDLSKKWGTNVFPLTEPFEGRYLRFRYHQGGAKATVIRMPSAIGVYDGGQDESVSLPDVGPVVLSGKTTIGVPPRDSVSVPLGGAGTFATGAYLVAVKLEAGGLTYLAWQNLLVLPEPWKRAGLSRLGINAADANVHDKLERLGVGWVRFENLKWPFVSEKQGEFRFDGAIAPWHVDLDCMFASYRSHGLDILPFLFLTRDYEAPPGAPTDSGMLTLPPKDLTQYAEFAFQTAARYGSTTQPAEALKTADKKSGLGLIHVFELWNEPNLNDPSWGAWKGSLGQYYEMFRLGAEAVKRADPKARVSNGGFSGIGIELMDTLRSHTYGDGKHPLDFVDVLNVHFYTGRCMPEEARINANTGTFGSTDPRTFEENLALLVAWRDRHKPGLPIWLTETGYETNAEFGVDERTQAAWLARDVLLILASGIDKVMVFRESGSDGGRWGSAGVLRSDRSYKPSFFTYAMLTRELDGVEGGAVRLAAPDKDTRIYAWKRGGKQLLTAWALEGTAPFPCNWGKAVVTDAFGATRDVDTAQLTLTDFPVYLRDIADGAALAAAVAEASREKERTRAALQLQANVKAYLFDFGSLENVGGLVIGDWRRCVPVIAKDTWDEAKGYGFAPSAALQDDDQAWIGDSLERDSCRIGKGIKFRFRAEAGSYVLRVGVTPFEAKGRLSIDGVAGGPFEVTKAKGLVEIEVVVTDKPLALEMDGYANLKWLALVRKMAASEREGDGGALN